MPACGCLSSNHSAEAEDSVGAGDGAPAMGFAAKAEAGAKARAARAAEVAGVGGEAPGATVETARLSASKRTLSTGSGGGKTVSENYKERPFQRLEFLVRDWQVRVAGTTQTVSPVCAPAGLEACVIRGVSRDGPRMGRCDLAIPSGSLRTSV